MSTDAVLIHLLVILVAARVAAEVAERTGQAAVLFEILLGIIVGPSVLHLLQGDNFLSALGEIGAVLLLFEVGLQMDLRELARVGGDSVRVACIGILTPMVGAYFVLHAMGMSHTTALFLAGGITATSVGITARVFGDLRSLATPEARVVLGAAVADDIGGLLILAVVIALSSGGRLSPASMASTLGEALGYVLLATVVTVAVVPGLASRLARFARADGTLLVLGIAFALAVSWGASAAHLAPIVGAFIAGLALAGSPVRDDLHRRLTPVAQVLVPIFFLQIGIDTRVSVFAHSTVIAMAAAVSAVGIAGKVFAGLGVRPGRANRLLVGVAMIPRGEVGLIFAGIGLTSKVLDAQAYGILIAVVMVTTLVTPPLVRVLILRSNRRRAGLPSAAGDHLGGWLAETPSSVELVGDPPDLLTLRLGLQAAVACTHRQPGARLLAWLSGAGEPQAVWGHTEREAFLRLLREGNERSWRLLEVTGVLDRYLPVLGSAIARRQRDPFNLDPGDEVRFPVLANLESLLAASPPPPESRRPLALWSQLPIRSLVLIAALSINAFEKQDDPAAAASELAATIGLDAEETAVVGFLVRGFPLLPAAARRIDMGTEGSVLELAAHLGDTGRADALYILAVAANAMEVWQRERLDEQFELARAVLEHPDLAGPSDLLDLRRGQITQALGRLPADGLSRHLAGAPRRYLLTYGPEVVARHLEMTSTPLRRNEVRLVADPADPTDPTGWTVHVATRDRPGLFASIAWAFAHEGIPVSAAFASTWADGKAIDVFSVRAAPDTDWSSVRRFVGTSLESGPDEQLIYPVEGVVDVDNDASPWHTIVEIRARDRTGLLYRVATALADRGYTIHTALVTTRGDVAVDIFHLTGLDGGKLPPDCEADIREALLAKPARRSWLRKLGDLANPPRPADLPS